MTERKKLKISCGTVDCENGLHCYNQTKREAARMLRHSQQLQLGVGGTHDGTSRTSGVAIVRTSATSAGGAKPQAGPIRHCKSCGIVLVDWDRVHRCDIQDVEHTFAAMRTEWIRHHFWHRPIDRLALAYAYKKGREQLRERLRKRIRTAVGNAADRLWRDGAQTSLGKKPNAQNLLYFAQHATASCCRKCVAEWHNIPRDRALTEEEIAYLTTLAMRYVDERLPELPNQAGNRPPEDVNLGTLGVNDLHDQDSVPALIADANAPTPNMRVSAVAKESGARRESTRPTMSRRRRVPRSR
jgi:hypothetical protein